MLTGTTRSPSSGTEGVLDRLNNLKDYDFHLTGSRYFGWNRPDSDWDFFATSNRETMLALKEIGFKEDTKEGYQDGLTKKVYVLHGVHVQLVSDLQNKQVLNEFFKRNKKLLAIRQPDALATDWGMGTGHETYAPKWLPRPKPEQKAAWQTAVTLLLRKRSLGSSSDGDGRFEDDCCTKRPR